MSKPDPPYKIEFYADQNGRKPVLRWIEKKLTQPQRGALTMAIEQVLAYEGLAVVESEFGRTTTASGVYEFRLRQDEHELAARVSARATARAAESEGEKAEEEADGTAEAGDPEEPEAPPRKKRGERVFLRVFFHSHGDKVILLLTGYDKGKNPSTRHESKVIMEARSRLEDWRLQQQAAKKAKKRGR